MNISPTFALPIRTVAPYFLFSIIAYSFTILLLFFLPTLIDPNDLKVIGAVHLYLLGFVMMSIIGAMAQMSAVVAEVYHRYPNLFKWIFPLFGTGIVILVYAFYLSPSLLGFAGFLILIGLLLFSLNLIVILAKTPRKTAVTQSMRWSTLLLLIGIGIGNIMSWSFSGDAAIDPEPLVYSHIAAVLGGYFFLNIMGVSTVVLPMFGGCSRPSDNEHSFSFYTMVGGVLLGLLSGIFQYREIQIFSILFILISIVHYLFISGKIFLSRRSHKSDIWEKNLIVAFGSLILSIMSGIYGYIIDDGDWRVLSFYLLFIGFFGFLIFAHLYKIIPFLVWFERFSPLIEEHPVPTLQQMLPNRLPMIQWIVSVFGFLLSTFAQIFDLTLLWQIGIGLLFLSSMIFLWIILSVLNYRKGLPA